MSFAWSGIEVCACGATGCLTPDPIARPPAATQVLYEAQDLTGPDSHGHACAPGLARSASVRGHFAARPLLHRTWRAISRQRAQLHVPSRRSGLYAACARPRRPTRSKRAIRSSDTAHGLASLIYLLPLRHGPRHRGGFARCADPVLHFPGRLRLAWEGEGAPPTATPAAAHANARARSVTVPRRAGRWALAAAQPPHFGTDQRPARGGRGCVVWPSSAHGNQSSAKHQLHAV